MENDDDNGGEVCVRCGEKGEDRRTLWMACFYAMEELKIPFKKEMLFSAADPRDIEITKEGASIQTAMGPVAITSATVRCKGDMRPQGIYTLRVCKECRASWMVAILSWFRANPQQEPAKRRVGSGIFVRRNGANVEVTEEEWRQLAEQNGKAGLAPVRALDGEGGKGGG